MTLKNYAIYNNKTGLIENVIWLDSDHIDTLIDFPPQGFGLVEIPENDNGIGSIGWSYLNDQFIEPLPSTELVQPIVAGVQTF